MDETNDNEGLERRPGALYLVMALRHPSHGSELIGGLEKGDSIVIMVQLRTGHGACESWPSPGGNYCVDVCARVTRDGGTGWAWRLSEGSGLCQGSQLESSRVSTSSSRHPETRE